MLQPPLEKSKHLFKKQLSLEKALNTATAFTRNEPPMQNVGVWSSYNKS